MRGRQAVGAALAAALTAGAAWFGIGAATAGSQQVAAGSDRVEFRGWPGRSVDSMAQAQRLAGGRDNNTLILVAEFERAREVNLGANRFSTGDFVVFEETLYTARGRRVVGEDTVRCEFGIRSFTCEATFKLDGRGKIRVAGALFSSERGITLPVTGGTKDFSEAGGQFKVFELTNDRALFVFQLER